MAFLLNSLPNLSQQKFGKGGLKEIMREQIPDSNKLVLGKKKKKVVGINPGYPMPL